MWVAERDQKQGQLSWSLQESDIFRQVIFGGDRNDVKLLYIGVCIIPSTVYPVVWIKKNYWNILVWRPWIPGESKVSRLHVWSVDLYIQCEVILFPVSFCLTGAESCGPLPRDTDTSHTAHAAILHKSFQIFMIIWSGLRTSLSYPCRNLDCVFSLDCSCRVWCPLFPGHLCSSTDQGCVNCGPAKWQAWPRLLSAKCTIIWLLLGEWRFPSYYMDLMSPLLKEAGCRQWWPPQRLVDVPL